MLHSVRRLPVCGRLVYPSGAVANLVLKMECTNSCGQGRGRVNSLQTPVPVRCSGFSLSPDG